MTSPFEPAGEVARWRQGYENLLAAGIDYDVFYSHGALAAMLGLALEQFLHQRSALYRITAELETVHGRTLVSVAGQGYRVSRPQHHAELATDRKRRSRRQLNRACRLVKGTDFAVLTPDEQRELLHIQRGLVVIVSLHNQRLDRIEEILRRHGMSD